MARKTVGAPGLWFFVVTASAPMTVVGGAVGTAYATTGVVALPLAFVVLTFALAPLTVAFVAMSRHVTHAAPFYAFLARGLGRPIGVAAAGVVLLGYNAIEIALFGLLGANVAGFVSGVWWAGAAVALLLVAVLGVLQVQINARVLGVTLLAEIAMIALFDVDAFTRPAGGSVSFAPLSPDRLIVNGLAGLGGVLTLAIACFVGYEAAPAYGEEARTARSVGRATYVALPFLGLFYAVSAWAPAAAVGPNNVVAASQADTALPITLLAQYSGPLAGVTASVLLVTSMFASMLSFHNSVARNVFALAWEHVLPAGLARIGTGAAGGAPVGGSLVQSALAAVVVTVAVVAKVNPLTGLFTWLAAIGAVAVLTVLVGTSVAALVFFHGKDAAGGQREPVRVRLIAPVLGVVAGSAVLVVTVLNLSLLLGVSPESRKPWVVPGVVAAAAGLGLIWALVLRVCRPDVYRLLGRGRPRPLAVPEQRLAKLEV